MTILIAFIGLLNLNSGNSFFQSTEQTVDMTNKKTIVLDQLEGDVEIRQSSDSNVVIKTESELKERSGWGLQFYKTYLTGYSISSSDSAAELKLFPAQREKSDLKFMVGSAPKEFVKNIIYIPSHVIVVIKKESGKITVDGNYKGVVIESENCEIAISAESKTIKYFSAFSSSSDRIFVVKPAAENLTELGTKETKNKFIKYLGTGDSIYSIMSDRGNIAIQFN